MYYITKAGVKLLNEYDDLGGKFDRKTSPLTGQKDALHNLKGKPNKLKAAWGAAKEFVSNARDIRRKIKASPKGSPVHYAKEGGVDTKLEKLTGLYAKLKGRKFSSGSLEHPDYDPDIRGNKADRLSTQKFGARTARKGRKYAFHPTKQNSRKAYHQEDWKAHGHKKRPRRPSKYERVQRFQNRLRRRGHADRSGDCW